MTTSVTHKQFLKDNRALAMSFYHDMLFYRRFEERVQVAYTQGKFSGFCHLHIGQEAVCVGVQAVLRETDYVISGYRSHTQAIAKGIAPLEVMAEIFGKATGCCRGKGGSMHMFSFARRFFGGHGIVGGQAPLATGIAFKINYRNEDDLVVCYFGDAAMNQGQVMEAMNMAMIWNLPLLFIIENNRYGMGTDIKRTTSIEKLCDRAAGFGMPSAQMNGMNVIAVYQQTQKIAAQIRQQKQPFLLEALTYRYRGHSVSDPGNYRTKEELDSYRKDDPITKLGDQLVSTGIMSDKEKHNITATIKQQLQETEQQADAAEVLPVEAIYEDIYTTQLDR